MRYNSLDTEIFIDKSNLVHNFKYDYSLVYYINNNTEVKIICPIHGIFEQLPLNHLDGHNCLLCGYDKAKNIKKLSNETILNRINNIYGTACLVLNINDYKNMNSKLNFKCLKHNFEFSQYIKHILNGVYGCKKCNRKKNKSELVIEKYFIENNIYYIPQKSFEDLKYKSKLFFDFYLSEYNICIEFDGEQHYKPIKFFGGDNKFDNIKKCDKLKNDYCKENNIKLYRIGFKENILERLNNI